jgi:glutamate carboxypeptidase
VTGLALAYCERELPWLLDAIESLVRIESPTGDVEAISRCSAELERRLVDLGGRVERLPGGAAGDHLRAEFGAGSRQLLLIGHMDTVWPVGTLADRPIRRDAGRLFGPGVFDMKAGLGLALLALRWLAADQGGVPGRVVLLVTSDEETGSATSRGVIEAEARRSTAVLVLEPPLPGGALKTSRKGCGEFTLSVQGVSAHAGIDPERGSSAISELARQIPIIEALDDPSEGTTINVGIVRGGSRPNVVASWAEAAIDVRVATAAGAARVTAALRALTPRDPGTSLIVAGGIDRPPLERSAGVIALLRHAQAVALELGRDLAEGKTGGASDGNLTAAMGVPTLDGLGAVGAGAHADDEHVTIGDLPWRAALLAGLLRRIPSG